MDFLIYFFEIKLIKDLGYDTDLVKYSKEISSDNDFHKIKIDGYIYEVPNYLIQQKIPTKLQIIHYDRQLRFQLEIIL